MKQKALFLDRDGILNVDKAYVYKFEDINWVDGIFDLIAYANNHGFLVIVLTNQSGVAQGMYKEEDVIKLHQQMNEFLRAKKLKVDDWFYCTEYDSPRRKPRPGMMIEARDKYNIDLIKSFMVGDKVTDVLDIKDGPQTFLLQGNYPLDALPGDKKVEVFSSLHDIQKRLDNVSL
ncbi:MAG: HAD family hydrolase [Alphaproteobacteria bacterium]|nr:MAG: HAD family hydrolase [Alphaproteobacteria bacterium]